MALESERSKTHGGGSEPRNSKPRETTENVAGESRDWGRGNGLVVVAIVAEDGAKVADNVDDEEDGSLAAAHGQERAAGVAVDGVELGGLHEEVVDCAGRAENVGGGIGGEGKDEDDHQDDNSVDIVCVLLEPLAWIRERFRLTSQEGGLDTSKESIDHDTNGEQEASSGCGHASQSIDDSRATSEQHGGDQNVCEQAKARECQVGVDAVPSTNDLHCMAVRNCPSLVQDGDSYRKCGHWEPSSSTRWPMLQRAEFEP